MMKCTKENSKELRLAAMESAKAAYSYSVIALVYHMYLTPKTENAPTFDMIVTEFNTLEEVDGKLMVTHLDLYTDGGGLNHR